MSRQLVIDGRVVNDDSDCYVVAEIGHNHQGELAKARELIQQAKQCGVDAVKLQKRDNRSLYTAAMYEKPYDHENSFGATYGEHREFLEFGRDGYRELLAFAREIGVTLFATAFDERSADLLAELHVPAFKIASGDLRNLPLLRHVAAFQQPVILSTGGASMDDVERAYDAVRPINGQLCLLQCTAVYPAIPEHLNLRVITTFRERFPDVVAGLSDHYNGISIATAAYLLGARVIEKHFTLNHTWKGTDHAFSLEPIGMHKMVRDLRRARVALGDGVKRPYPEEAPALYKMGKSLVASRELPAGHVLARTDIAIKSPGGGLAPFELDRLLGKTLVRSLRADEQLLYEYTAEHASQTAKS